MLSTKLVLENKALSVFKWSFYNLWMLYIQWYWNEKLRHCHVQVSGTVNIYNNQSIVISQTWKTLYLGLLKAQFKLSSISVDQAKS